MKKNNKIRLSLNRELTDYEITWFEMESQAKERKEMVEASIEYTPHLNADVDEDYPEGNRPTESSVQDDKGMATRKYWRTNKIRYLNHS